MDNNEEENNKEKKKGLLKQFISYISKLNIKKDEDKGENNSTNLNTNNTNLKNGNNTNSKFENVENDLYYYIKFPNESSPILFIAIIYFHHKKGSIIEYTYPSKDDLIKNNKNIELLLDENKKLTKENIIDDIFNQLTNFCLPDGIHNSTSDNQFFIIQNFKYPLFGISCYRQIIGENDISEENTRHFTQKSICIISTLPLYSQLYSKLSITLEAYFYQNNLQDKKIISELYNNVSWESFSKMDMNDIYLSFNVKKLLLFTKDKIFTIIKMILLEKKILVYSQVSGDVCSFIYNLISLIPGQLLFNLRTGNSVKNYIKYLNMYGLPFIIFHNNYKFFPLISLFDIDKIQKDYKSYLIGTTNQLIYKDYLSNKKYDLLIDFDTGKIIMNKHLNKDIFENSKYEKKIYNLIHSKFKSLNLKFEKETWINSLKEINYDKINENELFTLDDYIRNQFKNYFINFLSDLDLSLNLIKTSNFSLINLLNFEKEINSNKKSKIFNEKILKKPLKKILLSQYNLDFIFSWIKNSKSFTYWIKNRDEILYNLSKYIITNKQIQIILEDGYSYMGNLINGLPNGQGTLNSFDNKYIYDGEFKDGLKNGNGKLIISDGTKYSGNFLNDLYNGNGVLCDKNGNIYEGDFENGLFNGYGHYTLNDGNVYIGRFKNGFFEGKGQFIYKDGTVYDGEFVNGKKNGKGILLYNNGFKVEGIFKDDKLIQENKI